MKPVAVTLSAILLSIGTVFCAGLYQHHERVLAPETTFTELTGSDLPPPLKTSAYESEITDNLFHSSHYWLLSGPESDLRNFALSRGFTESNEDAKQMVPNVQKIFSLPSTKFVAGFEKDNGRNSWLILLEGAAIYVRE